jgi:hypothetical protein
MDDMNRWICDMIVMFECPLLRSLMEILWVDSSRLGYIETYRRVMAL